MDNGERCSLHGNRSTKVLDLAERMYSDKLCTMDTFRNGIEQAIPVNLLIIFELEEQVQHR